MGAASASGREVGRMEKPHKKIDAWKLSMELSRAIYRLTAGYPGEERLG
jgi:hypothetical protein